MICVMVFDVCRLGYNYITAVGATFLAEAIRKSKSIFDVG